MKKRLILFFLLIICFPLFSQDNRSNVYGDVTAGAGSYRGSFSLSFLKNYKLGSAGKITAGIGIRATSMVGSNQYYITAPARLTSGSNSPLVLFKNNIEENLDSILVKSPQVNFVNVMINVGYEFSKRISIGFNIDVIGFSFGKEQRVNFMSTNTGKNIAASPTPFNILLISDNDRGSLNSELYVKYNVREQWQIKVAGQFLFTEYTTHERVQKFPEENDRFRNKALLVAVGLIRRF